jgi:hypothetical protein
MEAFLDRAKELGRIKSRGPASYWVDHQTLTDRDLDILIGARHLTLWNVKLPPGFLEELPQLELLDIRGGTSSNLTSIAPLVSLRGLVINQVRGLGALDEISDLVGLEILSLYGLAHIRRLPSFDRSTLLRRVEVGQMRSLVDISSLAGAPALEELYLVRKLPLDAESVRPLRGHPTLRAFDWYFEDVPWSRVEPVLQALPTPEKARPFLPLEWLERNGRAGGARGADFEDPKV